MTLDFPIPPWWGRHGFFDRALHCARFVHPSADPTVFPLNPPVLIIFFEKLRTEQIVFFFGETSARAQWFRPQDEEVALMLEAWAVGSIAMRD